MGVTGSLFAAVMADEADKIKLLVASGMDVNMRNSRTSYYEEI